MTTPTHDTADGRDTTLYDLPMAAARLSLTPNQVRRLARIGELGSVRIGAKRALRFSPTHLADFIDANSRPADA